MSDKAKIRAAEIAYAKGAIEALAEYELAHAVAFAKYKNKDRAHYDHALLLEHVRVDANDWLEYRYEINNAHVKYMRTMSALWLAVLGVRGTREGVRK